MIGMPVSAERIPDQFYFDLVIFFHAATFAQLISYKSLTAKLVKVGLRRLAAVGMVFLVILNALSTYNPPNAFLFEDPHTHRYGIPVQ